MSVTEAATSHPIDSDATKEPTKLTKLTADGKHCLQSQWSFWYDKKFTKATKESGKNYQNNLTRLGSFDTVEDFWNYYCYLHRPSSLDKDINFYLFRNQEYPAWETYPEGGCWILKVKKNSGVISKLWQDLLFAAVGEQFGTPDVVGIMMAIRSREDMISIWNKDNFKSSYEKFKIAEKLKHLLNLEPSTVIEYKSHKESIKDGSTFRNAQKFVIASVEE